MCPHGLRSQPKACSQCIGTTPQRVTSVGAELFIDGEPAGRTFDNQTPRADRAQPRRSKR